MLLDRGSSPATTYLLSNQQQASLRSGGCSHLGMCTHAVLQSAVLIRTDILVSQQLYAFLTGRSAACSLHKPNGPVRFH